MKDFSTFLTEADTVGARPDRQDRVGDDLVTTFGRHNPPHRGHLKTMDHAEKLAGSIGDKSPGDQRFYTSRSNDPKKNPLDYDTKVRHLQKMFPQHSQKWDTDQNVKTVLDAAKKGHQQGYKNFHYVGGSDRRQGMEDLLNKYNGNLYQFDNIYSHSAGDRDESGVGDDEVAQMSASQQRKYAMTNDFANFRRGLSIGEHYTEDDARELFDYLRKNMTKNEDWEVDPRSNKEEIREMYADGRLYIVGDIVESQSSGLVGKVHRCGANHLICVTENGIMFKNFIHDVRKV